VILSDQAARTEFMAEFMRRAGWDNTAAGPIGELFATVEDELFPGAVLPRRKGSQNLYYALADTSSNWRTLTSLLRAFVGFTLTDFTGPVSELQLGDEVEQWLAGRSFAGVARFDAGGDTRRGPAAAGGLLRLQQCLHRPGAPRRSLPRTTPRVLSEFRLALVNRDRATAEDAMAFLATNMRLDAMNLRFLAVHLRAALGEWQELHDESFFVSLCSTRRSPAVINAMAEAVYRVMIEPVELAGGPAVALGAFKERVAKNYGTLFESAPSRLAAPAARAFLLSAAAAEPADRVMVEKLAEQRRDWTAGEQTAFDTLYEALFPQPIAKPEEPPARAEVTLATLLERGVEGADQPTEARARAILYQAAELQSLDGYRVALAYVEHLPEDEFRSLRTTPGIAGMLADISRLAVGGRVPGNWREWVEMLPEMGISQAREWAEKAASEWSIIGHLDCEEAVREFADALMAVRTGFEDRLYDALPELVMWVRSDPRWPNPAYLLAYERIFLLLVMSARRTPKALDAAGSLLDGMLSVGLNKRRYRDLMSNLGELVRDLQGYGFVDWLIDLAAEVASYAAPDRDVRIALWGQIVATIRPLAPQLTSSQRAVLESLRIVPGVEELLAVPAAAAPPPPRTLPRGYTLGVYTLTPGVAQQIEGTLRDRYVGLTVTSSDAHVSTRQLEDLAENADLMVIYTASATHAATVTIRQRRPRDLPIIYASGRGPSRVLREIEAQLDKAAAQASA
jgi:hypothetical protein